MNLVEWSKNIIKNCFRSIGFDVVRYDIANSEDVLLRTILQHFRIETVLDVGANKGQYALGILKHGYKGKIYSFEPILSVYKLLEKRSSNSFGWTALNLGVGSKDEEVMINVSENIVSSSLYKVRKESLVAEPTTRIVRQERIRITTLDKFLAEQNFTGEVLLKLDVQGYELEALKGATGSLPGIKLIQAELSFVPVYDGIPLFGEIVSYLEQKGYKIFAIIPGFRDRKTGRMLQADGIFVRED